MTIEQIMTMIYVGVVVLVNLVTMIAVIKKRKDTSETPTETTNQEIEIVKEELNNCIANIKTTLENANLSFNLTAVKKEIKKVL